MAKKHKLTSEEIERLMGMALRYGAFTMWAITEQPKMVADKCESIMHDGLNKLSRDQAEKLKNSVEATNNGEKAMNMMLDAIMEVMGRDEKERFKEEIGGAFWKSVNCWHVEKAFIGLHQDGKIYDACSSFMHDHIDFVAAKVKEHGSMDKYISTLSPPESNAPSS